MIVGYSVILHTIYRLGDTVNKIDIAVEYNPKMTVTEFLESVNAAKLSTVNFEIDPWDSVEFKPIFDFKE